MTCIALYKVVFYLNVVLLRKERGITLVDISKTLNIDRFNENIISYSTLIALADYFNVSLDYLTGRTDNPEINHITKSETTEKF